MFHPQLRRKAFSLVELLVVIGIIAIMAVLASTAFTFIGRAGGVTKTGQDIAGILEQARAHAMAHNTYVWVCLENRSQEDTLRVQVFASRNGNNVSTSIANENNPGSGGQTDSATTIAELGLVQLNKTQNFKNTQLVKAPTGERPDSEQVIDVPEQFKILNRIAPHVIQFNSRGEARISSETLNRIMELGLQSYSGGAVRNPENYSAVQIAGLSGAVTLYRP